VTQVTQSSEFIYQFLIVTLLFPALVSADSYQVIMNKYSGL